MPPFPLYDDAKKSVVGWLLVIPVSLVYVQVPFEVKTD